MQAHFRAYAVERLGEEMGGQLDVALCFTFEAARATMPSRVEATSQA